jgi:hypothetical protein
MDVLPMEVADAARHAHGLSTRTRSHSRKKQEHAYRSNNSGQCLVKRHSLHFCPRNCSRGVTAEFWLSEGKVKRVMAYPKGFR